MAKLKVVWAVEAKNTFHQIALYYNIRAGNNKYSRKLYAMIVSSSKLVARFPYMYRATSVKDTRVFVCEYFKVYYSVHPNYILLETIFDTRQDPKKDIYQ